MAPSRRLRPIAAPEGRSLSDGEWRIFVPEKLESTWGGLGWDEAECLDLLALALVSVGLRRAVRLAPRRKWEEALDAVYPRRATAGTKRPPSADDARGQ